MATDPHVAPVPYPSQDYRDMAAVAMAKMPSNEQMHRLMKEAEERRIKEQHMKTELYRHLVDAWSMASPPNIIREETDMLGNVLRSKIEEHKRMIATLEWFASHISLDNPEESMLVGRVILEGLNAMSRNRLG